MSTRDELIADLSRPEHAPMSDHDPRDGSCRSCPVPVWALGVADIADALIAEGWRKVPDRDEIAAVIANHFITRGQQVASGVTCECGYWTGNEPEAGKRPLNWGRDRLGLHRADLVLALMDRGQ